MRKYGSIDMRDKDKRIEEYKQNMKKLKEEEEILAANDRNLHTDVNDKQKKLEISTKRVEERIDEVRRVHELACNVNIIINNYEEKFEKATKLDCSDMRFLFWATALQCARWIFQPKITTDFKLTPRTERGDAGKEGYKERKERERKVDEVNKNGEKSNKYITIKKMYMYPVPYDAMEGTKRIYIPGVSEIGSNLYGGNHHSATMGHDPVLGYLFGTMNIMTRTITFKNPGLQTCRVHLKQKTVQNPQKYSGQYVGEDALYSEVLEEFKGCILQDKKRLPAGVARHALHIQSDKYCKDGLPIPFISPELAQKLIDEDWNSEELIKLMKYLGSNMLTVGVQAGIGMLIDVIISYMHKLNFDENSGMDKKLYEVKTQNILRVSNVISGSSNLLTTVFSQDVRMLDVGGLINMIYRINKYDEIKRAIKKEFVYGSYYDLIRGTN